MNQFRVKLERNPNYKYESDLFWNEHNGSYEDFYEYNIDDVDTLEGAINKTLGAYVYYQITGKETFEKALEYAKNGKSTGLDNKELEIKSIEVFKIKIINSKAINVEENITPIRKAFEESENKKKEDIERAEYEKLKKKFEG